MPSPRSHGFIPTSSPTTGWTSATCCDSRSPGPVSSTGSTSPSPTSWCSSCSPGRGSRARTSPADLRLTASADCVGGRLLGVAELGAVHARHGEVDDRRKDGGKEDHARQERPQPETALALV